MEKQTSTERVAAYKEREGLKSITVNMDREARTALEAITELEHITKREAIEKALELYLAYAEEKDAVQKQDQTIERLRASKAKKIKVDGPPKFFNLFTAVLERMKNPQRRELMDMLLKWIADNPA